MKTNRTQKTTRTALTGADHHPLALLSLIDGPDANYEHEQLAKYMEAARAILRSPHAFDSGIDTLAVHNHVLRAEVLGGATEYHERDKEANRAIARIIKGDEGEAVTADAWNLLSMLHRAIDESTLYGAALMYELLRGGAR